MFIYDRDNDGYSLEAGGDLLCRDRDTGQNVDENLCDERATKIYGRVEATFTLPLAGASIGTGARLTSGSLRPYGTAAVPLLPMLNLKGNVGSIILRRAFKLDSRMRPA